MAITSDNFYKKFKAMFNLPDNLIEFKIIGKVDEIVIVECTMALQSQIDGIKLTETKRYKLVETDD